MSASVLSFDRRPKRVWRLVEMSPGVWRGELHIFGKGITTVTADGHYLAVRDAVDNVRCGIPVRLKRWAPDNGPVAA